MKNSLSVHMNVFETYSACIAIIFFLAIYMIIDLQYSMAFCNRHFSIWCDLFTFNKGGGLTVQPHHASGFHLKCLKVIQLLGILKTVYFHRV